MIFRRSKSFQKISKKTLLVENVFENGWLWTAVSEAEGFQENILDGFILVYNPYSEKSVCSFTKRMTLPSVFPGEIFENR